MAFLRRVALCLSAAAVKGVLALRTDMQQLSNVISEDDVPEVKPVCKEIHRLGRTCVPWQFETCKAECEALKTGAAVVEATPESPEAKKAATPQEVLDFGSGPTHEEIQLAAYYLSLEDPSRSHDTNWHLAEEALKEISTIAMRCSCGSQ